MNKGSIYEKIEEQGRLDAEEILNASKAKAAEMIESIVAEANASSNDRTTKAREKNYSMIKTARTSDLQASKQEILAKKKALIHETFVAAVSELKELSDEELVNYVKNYITNNDVSGNELVMVTENEVDRYKKLFSSKKNDDLDILNKMLGDKYHLTLAKEYVNAQGGFKLVGSSFDVDLTYEAVLNDLEEAMETEVASLLFAEVE